MSGGSLDYFYEKVHDIAETIDSRAQRSLHKAFAEHLNKVAVALKALEWEWSCDTGDGDSDQAIREVLSRDAELNQTTKRAEAICDELTALLKAKDVRP